MPQHNRCNEHKYYIHLQIKIDISSLMITKSKKQNNANDIYNTIKTVHANNTYICTEQTIVFKFADFISIRCISPWVAIPQKDS